MAVSALLLVSTETAQQHYIDEKGVPVGGALMPEDVDVTYWEISQERLLPRNVLCTWPPCTYCSIPHIRPPSHISPPPTLSVEVLAQTFLSRK